MQAGRMFRQGGIPPGSGSLSCQAIFFFEIVTCGFWEACQLWLCQVWKQCAEGFSVAGWIPKAWGGALCFIPILNLFAFGYLLEYARQIRQSSHWDLPEWRDHEFSTLFLSGIRFLLLLLAYVGVPLLVGFLLSLLILGLTFGMLGIIAFFPLAAAGCCPFLFLSSIHAYLEDGIFSTAFRSKNCPLRTLNVAETAIKSLF